jgi:pyruvate dehydrogenase (quinone)/pyruvate oxidase
LIGLYDIKAIFDESEDNAIILLNGGTNTILDARYINIRRSIKFSVSDSLATTKHGHTYATAAQIACPERQSVVML